MNISNKIVTKFQEGGPAPDPSMGAAPAPGGAPAGPPTGGPEGGQDPIMQIAEIAMQALETQDCQAAMAVCEAFISLLQGGQEGGGGAPAPEQGAPVFKKGGKLATRK